MSSSKKLAEICCIRTGKLDSNQFALGGQYPFFTCAPTPLAIDSYAFDDDVILIAGNNAGGNFHLNRYRGKFNAYQRTYILTSKERVNLDYVFYSLKLELMRLKGKSQGSQTKFLTMPILNSIEVAQSSDEEQTKIAAALSALDAKIELNNRINAELEGLAKLLYDYWFVQYDFPDENGKPYKSSGGAMVYNEQLKREIPAGWGVGALIDIANITMGQSPPGESYNENCDGELFFQGCTDFGARFPKERQFTTQPTRFARLGDILLSVRAPVGTINLANKLCCIGRGLAALNSKTSHQSFLYGVMLELKQVFDSRNAIGTTFGSITKEDLFSLSVILPPENILDRFELAVKPMFLKQNRVESESIHLETLRDWLLPMLMNGQVRVEGALSEVKCHIKATSV